MKTARKAPCSYCGQEINTNARACPFCGSDESTGWSEERYLDGIDLPGDELYSELKEREFGGPSPKKTARNLWIAATAILLLCIAWAGLCTNLR